LNHDIGRQLVGGSTLIAGFHSRFVTLRHSPSGAPEAALGVFLSGAAGGRALKALWSSLPDALKPGPSSATLHIVAMMKGKSGEC
jgi:hypothetical protein